VRIGATWRSPLDVTTTGSGTIEFMGGPSRESIEMVQKWPQQASLGIGFAASPALKLAAQLDWTQWSRMKALEVTFPANPGLSQTYRLDWRDNWAVRAGAEVAASSRLALRGGAYVDTPAVPDRTIERQYQDSLKFGVSGGATLSQGAWRFDVALDGIIPRTRTVPNNSAETAAFPADRNKAPGEYRGTLITLELAAGYRF
jgi:long-subunit fatty acid transport protein